MTHTDFSWKKEKRGCHKQGKKETARSVGRIALSQRRRRNMNVAPHHKTIAFIEV